MANLKIKVGAAANTNKFDFTVYYDSNKATSPISANNTNNVNGFYNNMFFEYENGKGRYYSAGKSVGETKYIAETTIEYTVMLLGSDSPFILGESGFEVVRIFFSNPNKVNGTFTVPITLFADESMSEAVTKNYTIVFVQDQL